MKISIAIKTIMLITILLNYTKVFAQTPSEPDWRKQNAQIESIEANTAEKKAATASQKADTASQNANTASQNANTASQNANTTSQTAPLQNTSTTTIVVTPVPAPKEVTVAPAGFANCFVVKAGWANGVWITAHRVCKYNSSKEGVAWIEGYWACSKYRATGVNGECTNWDWRPGRWVKTLDVY